METEIRRGDVYWRLHQMDDGTIGMHRPVVIVSSDRHNANAPWLMIVPTSTSKNKYGVVNPVITSTGRESRAMCNQVQCIKREDLVNYLCSLTEDEMADIEKGLRASFGLEAGAPDSSEEITRLEKEIEDLQAQIDEYEDGDTEIVVERDMWKRMYEKAMEMLVDAKMPVAEPKVEEPKVEAPVVEEPEEEPVAEPKPDINTCTESQLRACGCNPTLIHHIVNNRPYSSVDDLRRVPTLTSFAFLILKNKVCCIPVVKPKKAKSKKLNINTATVKEMEEVAGIPKWLCPYIRAYRNTKGNFEKVEDLLSVSHFTQNMLDRFGPMLEV